MCIRGFFTCLKSLSVSNAEHLCNVDYEKEMAFVATIGRLEDEQNHRQFLLRC